MKLHDAYWKFKTRPDLKWLCLGIVKKVHSQHFKDLYQNDPHTELAMVTYQTKKYIEVRLVTNLGSFAESYRCNKISIYQTKVLHTIGNVY